MALQKNDARMGPKNASKKWFNKMVIVLYHYLWTYFWPIFGVIFVRPEHEQNKK
jgi:hypothetical protein